MVDRSALLPLEIHRPRRGGLLGALEPGELCGSLPEALDGLCRSAVETIGAEVASVYGLERDAGGDSLVVLGNVGFPREVIGNLRLRLGDGLVGWVAECLQPITLASAADDPRFRAVRGIGEEIVPVLMAVPIVRKGKLRGVLVLQRTAADGPFDGRDVRVAELCAESAGVVLEAGARRGPQVHAEDDGEVGAAVSLLGATRAPGFGFGRVEVLPSAEALGGGLLAARQVHQALARLRRDVEQLTTDLGPDRAPDAARAMVRLQMLLGDARFVDEATAAAARSGGLADLARAYARAPFRTRAAPDPEAIEHARDVEELCVLIHLIATSSRMHRDGQIWIGQRVGACFALAAAGHAAAVAIDGGGEITEPALAILRAAKVPVVDQVHGLFAWTRPGDLAMIEADHGLVRINPASTGVVAARARRASR